MNTSEPKNDFGDSDSDDVDIFRGGQATTLLRPQTFVSAAAALLTPFIVAAALAFSTHMPPLVRALFVVGALMLCVVTHDLAQRAFVLSTEADELRADNADAEQVVDNESTTLRRRAQRARSDQ